MKLKDNVTLTETVEKLNKKNIKLLKQIKAHEEEVIELNEYIDSLEAQIADYKRRFVPDFISQTGSTRITFNLRDFPNDSQSGSPLGPFDITSSTKKIDTRARARAIALKVDNTSTTQHWKLGTFRLDIQPDGRR